MGITASGLITCPYKDPCCMRSKDGGCSILIRVTFPDQECHFRKASPNGPNLYDLKKGEKS